MTQSEQDNERGGLLVTFVGDPMCSWCYGFAPELQKLRDAWAGRASFRLLVGGLRRDQSAMGDRMRAHLRHHWDEVGKRTGQPFNYDILETELVYDTEPACRATVTARYLSANADEEDSAFRYFDRAQELFYRENRDPGDSETWVQLAATLGFDPDRFLAAFHGDDLRQMTLDDFASSREMGITGYPSIVAEHAGKRRFITLGYADFELMDTRLRDLVALADG